MSAFGKYVAAVLVVALVTHFALLQLAPGLIMDRVMGAIEQRVMSPGAANESIGHESPALQYVTDPRQQNINARAGWNVALPSGRPDHTSRGIVRPSPDLLYTVCLFDVSRGPVILTAPVQDSYVSLSGFAANTDNFFAINDSQVAPDAEGRKRFDVVLLGSVKGSASIPDDATVVAAPTDRGIVLFRSLVRDDAQLDELYRMQARQLCTPL